MVSAAQTPLSLSRPGSVMGEHSLQAGFPLGQEVVVGGLLASLGLSVLNG